MKNKISLILFTALSAFFMGAGFCFATTPSSNFVITSDGDFRQYDITNSSLCYYAFSVTTPHNCSGTNIWAAHNCNSSVNLDCPVGSYAQGALCNVTTPDNGYLICNYGTSGFGGTPPYSYMIYKYGSAWTAAYVPPGPSVSITSPASGSTVTADTAIVTGSFANLSSGFYGLGYLRVWFVNKNSGISSMHYTLLIPAENGNFSTPFSTFGITENGEWELRAQQELDANTFWDLTPDPEYSLIFNIGGLPTPYAFSNFDNWYSENAAGGYTEPSGWATSLTAFIQPIFTSAGEFVNNSLRYFNANDFYSKGNQLGLVFPTTQAYLNKINIFFGGFPLIQFFELLTFVMLGIFIVRTIFKFIPFFG